MDQDADLQHHDQLGDQGQNRVFLFLKQLRSELRSVHRVRDFPAHLVPGAGVQHAVPALGPRTADILPVPALDQDVGLPALPVFFRQLLKLPGGRIVADVGLDQRDAAFRKPLLLRHFGAVARIVENHAEQNGGHGAQHQKRDQYLALDVKQTPELHVPLLLSRSPGKRQKSTARTGSFPEKPDG